MKNIHLLSILNLNYSLTFTKIRLKRQGGNKTYFVYSEEKKYFLKVVNKAFLKTFLNSIKINKYLQDKCFPVAKIISCENNDLYIEVKEQQEVYYLVLYEFLELKEINVCRSAKKIGNIIGQLHKIMSEYHDTLVEHNFHFYIGRYLEILKTKKYSKVNEFQNYGERLWERISNLPRGYSHGDMYSGNIAKGKDNKLYILDFDTSCMGFRIYDLALICNQTNYFKYEEEGIYRTKEVFSVMLPSYLQYIRLANEEITSLYDMIALYHFTLQATIIEIYGLDCVNNSFFDTQLDWLKRWEKQTKEILK